MEKRSIQFSISLSLVIAFACVLIYGCAKKNRLPTIRTVETVEKKKPLVYIDGIEFTNSIDSVDTDDIEEITVIKGESAIELYGNKGKDGVVKITTKSFKEQKRKELYDQFRQELNKAIGEGVQVIFYLDNILVDETNFEKLIEIEHESIRDIVFTPDEESELKNSKLLTIYITTKPIE